MARVNLLVACWGGSRFTPHSEYEVDRAYYLKLQLDSLSRFRHHLTQITFISNGGDEYYRDFLRQIPHSTLERENLGISYGAWAAGIRKYPNFDYYILLEDDYLFVRDNFDQILLNKIESVPNCGYVASVVMYESQGYPYPALSCGMVSRKCLDKMPILPGEQAEPNSNPMYAGADWQLAWGRLVTYGAGMALCGMDGFRFPFDNPDGSVVTYNDAAPDYLIVPARTYRTITQSKREVRMTVEQEEQQQGAPVPEPEEPKAPEPEPEKEEKKSEE